MGLAIAELIVDARSETDACCIVALDVVRLEKPVQNSLDHVGLRSSILLGPTA